MLLGFEVFRKYSREGRVFPELGPMKNNRRTTFSFIFVEKTNMNLAEIQPEDI